MASADVRRDFVTVVTGLPRSGTSLALQMLAAGGLPVLSDGVRAPDAGNPRGYLEHAQLRRVGSDPAAAALVAGAKGRALKLVHALIPALPRGPDYRLVWMERALGPVIASQDALLALAGEARPALPAERVAAVFAAQLDALERELAGRPDVRLLRLRYERVVADPAAAAAALDAFLGGGLDRAAMAAAVVPSLSRHGPVAGYTAPMADAPAQLVERLGPLRFEVEHREPGPAGGPTLRVHDAASGRQLLRFDCFLRGGHWHLDPDGRDEISALGLEHEPLEWCVDELRRDLDGWAARAGVRAPLPRGAERDAALARVEAALRNPPPRLDGLDLAVLRERQGEKWQVYPEHVLPLWVADMDFPVAEPVRRRLQRMLDVSDLGYPLHPRPTRLPEVFAERAARRHDWTLSPSQVRLVTEVVQGMTIALEALSAPGDGAIVQTPIYPPFLGIVEELGRRLVENPLRETPEGYRIDLDGLARAARQARVLLLCNPHNPTGRAFSRAELEAIAEIALANDLWIVADEIHADLVHAGRRHVPIASLDRRVAERTVTLSAASKAFNIAGLRCAVAVFGGEESKRRFQGVPRHLRGGLSSPGIEASLAAWSHADPWLEQVKPYLLANRDFVADFVARELPGVKHHVPEATYLAWLDCRALGLSPSPQRFFLEKAHVGLSDGPSFGRQGEGFVRLNFATSRAILVEALERMAKSLR